MLRFILSILRQAFAGPRQRAFRSCAARSRSRVWGRPAPSAAACRRAWGLIRARYPLKDLVVPA